ncbi:FecR family protein [Chitinophaga cymbidii]|uniref:Iron dicitrate transporter FecR n=1 Tax=Chitinophaga cymbidii TaxID=1096750 RepID=A0A512RJH4_9BACT|nr:FecR family protein [Chitinophaga cymbidii]GEP95857.1 iron dicitrate transporter FecR [Chitinophaga cymbidii]
MSNEETILYLLEKLRKGDATSEECRQLRQLITDDESGDMAAAANVFFSGREDITSGEGERTPYWQQALRDILQVDKVQPPARPLRSLRRFWIAAAAVILLVGMAGIYLWNARPVVQTPGPQTVADIAPGREGAVLTLADGTEVTLDSLGNGVVTNQQGTQVMIRNGQLVYDPTGEAASGMAYNTVTTPKGRQFSLLLPDGTQVWLNAASSIRFPTLFSGRERRVEVTGEAYFEVVRNADMPFHVKVNEQTTVEVLGTHFNIHAYKDESRIHTTLLEGSVKVGGVTLQPGQQAQVSMENPAAVHVVNNVDMNKVIAWKNGLFDFNGASLQEVMKQLERWYDIRVVYEKGVPDITFGGKMTKGVSLNGVLIALKKSEVHFRLEGRKLIVMP